MMFSLFAGWVEEQNPTQRGMWDVGCHPSRAQPNLPRILFLLILTLAILLSPHAAAAQQVRAWVDKDVATLEDQITLTVSVSGGKAPPQGPVLPSLPDFKVIQGGASRRIEIVNFKKSSTVEYNYFLLPKQTGTFIIEPIRVTVYGKPAESRPIQIKIVPVDQKPEERPPVFVTQEVSADKPYLNQQIV